MIVVTLPWPVGTGLTVRVPAFEATFDDPRPATDLASWVEQAVQACAGAVFLTELLLACWDHAAKFITSESA